MPPEGAWEVNWGDNFCMLIRHAGGRGGKTFAIRRVPGSGPADLIILDPQPAVERAPRDREIRITFNPTGREIEGRLMRSGRRPDGSLALEISASDALLEQFAESRAIEASQGRRSYFEMSYPAPQNALRAFRQCEDDALRQWGIDPAVIAALQTPPRLRSGDVITWTDYPPAAIDARQEGVVLTRLTVDAEGRVEDCALVARSGAPMLDQRTCELAVRRARFRPATDANGESVRSIYVMRVVWLLPDN